MITGSTFYRSATLALLFTGIAILALLGQDRAMVDMSALAARLMAPIIAVAPDAGQTPPLAAEPIPPAVAAREVSMPVRIHAEPDADLPAEHAPSETTPTSAPSAEDGVTALLDAEAPATASNDGTREPDLSLDPDLPEAADEASQAPVENRGDAEGRRLPVADLTGLGEGDPNAAAIAARLIEDGSVVLVIDLHGGDQKMMIPGPDDGAMRAAFVPWGPEAGEHSQLQVGFDRDTRVLPVAATELALRRAGVLDRITILSLVLTGSTEAAFLAAQEDALRGAGFEAKTLLERDAAVVVHGCWQPEGAPIRITAVNVDGRRHALPGREPC